MYHERLKSPENSDLQNIQGLLVKNNFDYRIIGDVAVNSYISNSSNQNKISDIDIIIPRYDLRRISVFFDNGGENEYKGKAKIDFSGVNYIDFRPSEKLSYLTFKSLEVPVESALFKLTIQTINGVSINTISPRALFHTFAVIGGMLRPKDWKKILPLGRYIKDFSDKSLFLESDFDNFHLFLKLREEECPNDLAILRFSQLFKFTWPNEIKIKHLQRRF